MRYSGWLLAVLPVALAIGCKAPPEPEPPPPPPPPVRAEPIQLDVVDGRIDMSQHGIVAVFDGEIVSFTCDCPEGSLFLVKDLQHLGSLRQIVVDHLPETAEEAASLAAPWSDEDRKATVEKLLGRIDDELLGRLAGAGEGEPQEADPSSAEAPEKMAAPGGRNPEFDDAFGLAWQNKPAAAGEEIRSEPYRDIEGDQLYKFTWGVQIGGEWQYWDPHIAGMGRGG